MAARGVRMDDSAGKAAKALSDANAECVAGFRPEASGRGRRRLPRRGRGRGVRQRVHHQRVATGPPPACGNGSGVYDAKIWKDNWYKNIAPNEYLYAGSQHYHTGDGFSDDPSNSVDKIMERHVDSTAASS